MHLLYLDDSKVLSLDFLKLDGIAALHDQLTTTIQQELLQMNDLITKF